MKALWQASDGTIFETRDQCVEHETKRSVYLTLRDYPQLLKDAESYLSHHNEDWDGCRLSKWKMFVELLQELAMCKEQAKEKGTK